MNLNKNLIFLPFTLMSAALTSCSPVAYSTTGQNVPLFREKGEAFMAVGYSTAMNAFDYADGLNVQAALAIDSSVAIMSSLYIMKQDNGEWSGKGNYIDVGVGMFKRNKSKKFTGEIFIGVGLGTIRNVSSDNTYFDIKFLKPFIQPSGGIARKHFEVAFTPRIALVSFKSQSNEDFTPDLHTTVVFEPGWTIRAGSEYFKFQYQTNFSTFSMPDASGFTTYNFYTSLGMSFLISERWADK